jgi:hypothetical protein
MLDLLVTLAKIRIMKKLLFLFFIISTAVSAQELKLKKATRQTVNHGASPTSSTTYSILVSNCKKGKWKLDSLISISSNQVIKFNMVKVDDTNAVSPNYKKLDSFNDLGKGNYQLTFGITKQRGSGRPGAPQNTKVDTTNIEGGVIVYYTVKKKQKQLKIDSFEELEKIDAP